jgi:hypothetical protein
MIHSSTATAAGKRTRFQEEALATHAWISPDGTYIITEMPNKKRKRILSPKGILNKKPKYSYSNGGNSLPLHVLSKKLDQLNATKDNMYRLHQASEKTRQSRRALLFASGRDIGVKPQQSWQPTPMTLTNLLFPSFTISQTNYGANASSPIHSFTTSTPQTGKRNISNKNNLALLKFATELVK